MPDNKYLALKSHMADKVKSIRVITLAENVESVFKKIQLTVAKYYQWLEKQAKISNK